LVFVSSCTPCVANLLSQYDHLRKQQLDVKVIARTPPERILEARREYGWQLPIYSDYEQPEAARACRVIYRPAALVLYKNGEVVYAQGANDDRTTAVSHVERCLRAEVDEH